MLLILLALAQGQPQAQPYLALVNGNVLDVRTGEIERNATVFRETGRTVR